MIELEVYEVRQDFYGKMRFENLEEIKTYLNLGEIPRFWYRNILYSIEYIDNEFAIWGNETDEDSTPVIDDSVKELDNVFEKYEFDGHILNDIWSEVEVYAIE